MNIKELLYEARGDASSVCNILSANPKQFISEELNIPIWQVKYKYTTARNNEKEAVKYIFLNEDDWDLVDSEFNEYIEKFNKKYPYKKISNVKILDVEYMGKARLPIVN